MLKRMPPTPTFTLCPEQEPIRDIALSLHIPNTIAGLGFLVSEFTNSGKTLEAAYGKELEISVRKLKQDIQSKEQMSSSNEPQFDLDDRNALHALRNTLRTHFNRRSREFDEILRQIKVSLEPQNSAQKMLSRGGLWPQITFRQLLTAMSQTGGWGNLTSEWKLALVRLAFSAMLRQRARRLLQLCLLRKNVELEAEFKNSGSFDEDMAIMHPDWLLIQVSVCHQRIVMYFS